MALHARALAILENNVGVSDAVLLDPMTEEAFIDNLKARFNHDQIYVSKLNVNLFLFNCFTSLTITPLEQTIILPWVVTV